MISRIPPFRFGVRVPPGVRKHRSYRVDDKKRVSNDPMTRFLMKDVIVSCRIDSRSARPSVFQAKNKWTYLDTDVLNSLIYLSYRIGSDLFYYFRSVLFTGNGQIIRDNLN